MLQGAISPIEGIGPDQLRVKELLSRIEPEDIEEVHTLVSKHAELTSSTVAKSLLADWKKSIGRFVKVMPTDFKRVMLEQKKERAAAPALAKTSP